MSRILRTLSLLVALATSALAAPSRDWSVAAFSELSTPGLTLKTATNSSESPNYEANNDASFGLSVRYKNFSASTGSPWFGTSRLDEERPSTRFFDLRLDWLGDEWGFESYGQYFRGFQATTSDYDSVLFENPHSRIASLNLNVYRAFGSGLVWRMRDGIGKTGIAFNPYLMAGVSRQSLRSPVPLLDTLAEGQGTPFESMTRFAYTGASAAVGVTVNTNLLGLYCDPTLFIGGGVQRRESDYPVSEWGGQVKVNLKLRTGYATERFDVGMAVSNDVNSAEFDSTYGLLFHSIVVRFFIATMF